MNLVRPAHPPRPTFLTSSVDYPEFIRDVGKALKFTRQHIRSYGGDPSRIILMGHSAGAHILCMLLLEPGFLREICLNEVSYETLLEAVKACVCLSGVFNLHRLNYWWIGRALYVRKVFGSDPDVLSAASPTVLSVSGPPRGHTAYLFLSAVHDFHLGEDADEMHQNLQKHGKRLLLWLKPRRSL